MTLMENKERFLLPLVPLFSEQSQRHSQLNAIAVENNLNPSKGDLPFKARHYLLLQQLISIYLSLSLSLFSFMCSGRGLFRAVKSMAEQIREDED